MELMWGDADYHWELVAQKLEGSAFASEANASGRSKISSICRSLNRVSCGLGPRLLALNVAADEETLGRVTAARLNTEAVRAYRGRRSGLTAVKRTHLEVLVRAIDALNFSR